MTEKNMRASTLTLERTLRLWDILPDAALVDKYVVVALTARSAASLYRDVKAGVFPKPISAGPRDTKWRVGDVKKFLTVGFVGARALTPTQHRGESDA